jgi:CDP-diacylglycerol--glycerol-3-phosphate 3-phosphatidyltransferase
MATVTPTRPPVFNLPNQLTAARFVLALVLFALIAWEAWAWCLVVFAVAAFTDWLDGYFARKQNLSSTLGRNLDPLVDKVLICGTYVFLLPLGATEGWLLPWMVTVVIARELVITSLRSYLESMGARFGADWLGKLKLGLQCAAIIAIFVAALQLEWFSWLSGFTADTRRVLIYAMLVITTLSGLQYLWKAVALLKSDGANP